MEAEAAKYIGAGLACFGMAGTALGLGNIFGSYLSGALRNPSAADSQFGRLVFGFAVTEALGIFSLLVALLLPLRRLISANRWITACDRKP
ncbi:F0F1 ATP synthase subunit C [Rhizobium leguminosarum]|nr:F0F1 ATP synthase subunit C [Rhizobium leguminosarum]